MPYELTPEEEAELHAFLDAARERDLQAQRRRQRMHLVVAKTEDERLADEYQRRVKKHFREYDPISLHEVSTGVSRSSKPHCGLGEDAAFDEDEDLKYGFHVIEDE